MVKKLCSCVVIISFILVGLSAFCRAEDASLEKVKETLKTTFPNFHFDSVEESPVKGLYQVINGGSVLYFSPQGYIVAGSILDKAGHDLTADVRGRSLLSSVKEIALKVGNGKNIVIEVSDPDCPYCRRASEYWKGKDVTRYIIFMPLPMHPKAELHAKYILAKMNEKAYEEAYSGQFDKHDPKLTPEQETQAADLLKKHEALAARMAVRGTPAFWVNGHSVSGANTPMIEQYLKDGGE